MDIIEFKGEIYPAFQSNGNASRFCIPFALEICKGHGVDIGYSKPEWIFPGAIGIDKGKFYSDGSEYFDEDMGATYFALSHESLDYIFSSHALEHIDDWVDALDYWSTKIKSGGHIFLYLPHRSQKYWLPFHNRKHIHAFDSEIIREYFVNSGQYKNIFVSGVDAYNSFTAFAEKI